MNLRAVARSKPRHDSVKRQFCSQYTPGHPSDRFAEVSLFLLHSVKYLVIVLDEFEESLVYG